jgi:hypothetical protein
MTRLRLFIVLLCLQSAHAEVPHLLHHQGRMAVQGVPFDGSGQFKFALVDATGSITHWTNDGTLSGQPLTHVTIPVTRGLYSVLLGDAPMTPLAATVFNNADVRLRVWFNDGTKGFQLITPDQRLVSAPYALVAAQVDQVLLTDIRATPPLPVIAWGKNNQGQATVPATLSDANTAAISAKGNTSLALLKSGSVVQWGSGNAPVLTGITAIAAGVNHALALKSDNTLAAWGDDTYGQANVNTITAVKAIAAGEKHSTILHTNGTVTTIGDTTFDQTIVPFLTSITAIAAGYDHSLALSSTGTVTAWGRNDSNQCDVPSAALTNVIAIAAGAYHSLALKNDGTLLAWGWDSAGQSTVPPTLTDVKAVAAGYAFSLALKNDGTLFAWGDSTDQQLTIPAEAASITHIAAGDSHVLVLKNDLIPAQVARLDQSNTFTGNIGIRRAPAVNALEVEGNASKTTAGSWLSNSDRRIKTDIRTLTGALEKIDSVRLVDFRYTSEYRDAHPSLDNKRYLNVIAQEFAKVFPDHVQSSGETLPDGSEILQVDTYPLTIYSAAAIQELHRENQVLKQQLDEQEQRLRRLEHALEK